MPPQEHMMETHSSGDLSCSEETNAQNACAGSEEETTRDGYTNTAFENEKETARKNSVSQNDSCDLEMRPRGDDAREEKKEDDNSSDPMDFDDMLPHIGEFGKYQRLLFLMTIPFAFFIVFVYFTQIFITLVPEKHFCHVPELANLTIKEKLDLAIPLQADNTRDRCRMYAVNYEALIAEGVSTADPSWPQVSCLHGWEYVLEDVPYHTISSELDWVCDNAALPSIAQAIFFVGAIIGGLLFGWIADKYGRIPAIVGTNLLGFAGGTATAFNNNFWTFCVSRFFVGMGFDNCFTMMYILVLEYVGPKWRTFVANMSIAIFFTMASCILPWMAWYIADWRILCLVTSVPLAIAIVTPLLVPESARWLVSQGKIERAMKIIKSFEKINGKTVDEAVYARFSQSCIKYKKDEENSGSYSVVDLFRTPHLRKITVLLIVIWMIISLVFDGHVRNVGSLGYNVFITFTIASATELPADTFLTLTLDRWGRRWLAFGTMAMSGFFSLLAVFAGGATTTAVFAIIGRFAVNISYNIGLQYAAELLPTVVRAQGVAIIHIMGYVASILAPFVVYLGNISTHLPLLILGFLGIVGGFLSLFLPETLNHELPQTLEDGEEFGKNQKLLEFPCCMKNVKDPEVQDPGKFRRTSGSARDSMRASFRGQIRSTMIQKGSVRSRTSRPDVGPV